MLTQKRPKVIIYGINHQAQQLKMFLEIENQAKVYGFVVDADYKKENQLLGLPVYLFEDIETVFSPGDYMMALSFGYRNMVQNRQKKFMQCKEKGYEIFTFISKAANVYSDEIGEGCLIYPGCFIAPYTKLGKGVFLENGVSIAHHTVVEDFCFFAPNAVICGDIYIERNCFFGSNCTIANAGRIKEKTLVAAGATLTKEIEGGTVCFNAKPYITNVNAPEKYI